MTNTDRTNGSGKRPGPVEFALWAAVPPSCSLLLRALEITASMDDGFARTDIERVESMWEIDDCDSASLGFVIALRDGRRVYLSYDIYPESSEDGDGEVRAVEDVELIPMAANERYPILEGGDVPWDDDVRHLNDCLAH